MKPVFSREEVRRWDAAQVAKGILSSMLMENAGRGVAEFVCTHVPPTCAPVVFLCGTGNNGGDGFVAARHLRVHGRAVEMFLLGKRGDVQGDAAHALSAWEGVGGRTALLLDDLSLLETACRGAGAVVDALFGTGLSRPVDGHFARAIALLNQVSVSPKIAIDIPSGLCADRGIVLGEAFAADHTVTLLAHKQGLLTPFGRRLAGEVHVVHLGVPCPNTPRAGLYEPSDVPVSLRHFEPSIHKGDRGHVGVLAGSRGKAGAAILAARGAFAAGAGLVTVGSSEEVTSQIPCVLPEAMTHADDAIESFLLGKTSLVVGPGLGLDGRAMRLVDQVLERFEGPMVLDADALSLFAQGPRALPKNAVLTPHPGEAARLLGVTSDAIERDRWGAVRELAQRWGAVVLLKGQHTLVAEPSGRVSANSTGSPALAVAGSGDVLSGVVGALCCRTSPFEAACVAALVHGLSGDRFEREGGLGLRASGIADGLSLVWGELDRRGHRDPPRVRGAASRSQAP